MSLKDEKDNPRKARRGQGGSGRGRSGPPKEQTCPSYVEARNDALEILDGNGAKFGLQGRVTIRIKDLIQRLI